MCNQYLVNTASGVGGVTWPSAVLPACMSCPAPALANRLQQTFDWTAVLRGRQDAR